VISLPGELISGSDYQLREPEGTKSVRFPTDEEWIKRQRRKIIIMQLGRGVSETTISAGEEADAALFAQIRQGEELDAYEASRILEQLSLAEVEDVVPRGAQAGSQAVAR
jgi:hypothetical protein